MKSLREREMGWSDMRKDIKMKRRKNRTHQIFIVKIPAFPADIIEPGAPGNSKKIGEG